MRRILGLPVKLCRRTASWRNSEFGHFLATLSGGRILASSFVARAGDRLLFPVAQVADLSQNSLRQINAVHFVEVHALLRLGFPTPPSDLSDLDLRLTLTRWLILQ